MNILKIFFHSKHKSFPEIDRLYLYPVVSDAIKTLFEDVGIGRKNVEASAREAVEKINIGINEIQKP
jgi:hypothetical protein